MILQNLLKMKINCGRYHDMKPAIDFVFSRRQLITKSGIAIAALNNQEINASLKDQPSQEQYST